MTIWMFQDQPFEEQLIDDNVGFVYLITNLVNGKKYIGKKLFFKRKISRRKGKKKTTTRVFSDWQSYWGSNLNLQQDVKTLGEHNFQRQILMLCKTKGLMSWWETKHQIEQNVLLDDNYYNTFVGCRIHKKHLLSSSK